MALYWLLAILNSIKGIDLLPIQIGFLLAITAYYFICKRDESNATQLLWAYLTFPIIALPYFISISVIIYLPAVSFLYMWSTWLYKRQIIDYLPFNEENIIIAFYKGEKLSFKMRMWSLIDMPVSSMCIINGNKVLRIKNKVYTIESSKNILNNLNYIKYDTGVKYNSKILDHMKSYVGMKNHESLFYSDCIESVSSLLYDIKPELKPQNWRETRPSVYFRKVLKIGR